MRSSTRPVSCPRRATSALAPSRSLTVETSSSGSTGFCRKASAPAASASSRASRTESASTAPAPCCFRRRHRSAPTPPEIISSTIASCGPTLEPLLLGFAGRQGQVHVVPLGAQEELRQFRRHGIAFGDQHEQPRSRAWTVVPQGLATLAVFGEQSVRVGRREPARNLRRDEAQLLHLIARVEAVSPRAPLRDDRRVALLPIADRRDRNARASGPPHRCCRRRGCRHRDRTRPRMLTGRGRNGRAAMRKI